MSKTLTISIVIPAYNEEDQIAACLDAIAKQTVMPFEVIVVDNNCADNTVAIAKSYPFVRIVRETKQGLIHARDAGFNAARGDIIGRLDSESVIAQNWTERVQKIFADHDVDAVSGSIGFTDVPFEALFRRVDSMCRHYLARNLARRHELFLFGGNMAMRRSIWQQVSPSLCRNPLLHEDIDMAAHMAATNFTIEFDDQLFARISARRIDSPFKSYYPYVVANSRTYAQHGLKGRFYMYPVQALVVVFHQPARLLYRCYDPATRQLSIKNFYKRNSAARVSPVVGSI